MNTVNTHSRTAIKSGVVLQTIFFLSSTNSAYAFGAGDGGRGAAGAWGVSHAGAGATNLSTAQSNAALVTPQMRASLVNPQSDVAAAYTTSATHLLPTVNQGAAFLHSLGMPAMPNIPAGTTQLGGSGLALDLASSSAEVVLGGNLFNGAPSANINVGGVTQTFRAGQRVTAAEYVAIKETLGGAGQNLELNGSGSATGGQFNLNGLGSHLTYLVVPANVTGIDNVSAGHALTVRGDIVNYGSIYALSTNSSNTTANIYGHDITNAAGGVISSVLPESLVSAVGGTVSNVDLNVVAANNLSNAGLISSSGNLALVAVAGSLANSGTAAAANNVNLYAGSGNFTNTGMVSAASGNINFVSPALANDISVMARGGVFQALNGDINFRDAAYDGDNNLTVDGGDFLSNNVNLYSGAGAIAGSLGKVTGTVNSAANATHLTADTDNLILGTNCAEGDPTYASTGNITINGAVTAGEAITILAGGNITAGVGKDAYISTRSLLAKASDITLIAGGKVTTAGTQTSTLPGNGIGTGTASVDLTAGAGTGGNIDLSGSTHNGAIIDAGNGLLLGAGGGGNVLLAALANGTTGGTVSIAGGGASGRSIDTTSQVGNGGNVTIFAGANPAAAATTINVGGSIQSSGGGTFKSGAINIATVNPVASSGSTVTYDADGGLHAGSATVVAGTNFSKTGNVILADLISAAGGGLATQNGGAGGDVTIRAGGNVSTGNIVAYGGGGGGASLGLGIGGVGGDGGKVSIQGDNGTGASSSISVNGGINTAGGGGGGSLLSTASGGGKGGNVVLNSTGSVTVASNIYTGDGAVGGTDGGTGDGSVGGGGGGSQGGGGGGAAGSTSVINLLLGLGAGSGAGGSGASGGGGGGVGVSVALGGNGGGIFTFGLGGVGDLVNGLLGALGLGGGGGAAGSGVAGVVSNVLGIGGGGGSTGLGKALGGLNVPGLTTDAVSNQNADITITGNGINLGGALFGRDVTIQAPVASNGSVNLTHDVTGTNSITLTAHGTGGISDGGAMLLTPKLTLWTDNGDIGSALNPLSTSADKLTTWAGSLGSVFLQDNGDVWLSGTNGSNKTYSLVADGDIKALAGATLKADSLDLTSTDGDIGPMTVTAPALTANATGSVDITNDYVGQVTLGASSADSKTGTFTLDATNATGLTTTGDISGHVVNLITDVPGAGINVGSKITGTNNGTVNLTADGDIQDSNASGLVTAGTLNVTSGSGDIGKSVSPFMTDADNIAANAAGNVYLQNKGATTLLDSSAGSGDTFSLSTTPDASGNGNITIDGDIGSLSGPPIGLIDLNSSESGKGQGGIQMGPNSGLLTAKTVSLSDGDGNGNGDLGSALSPLLTDASTLNAQTKGGVWIDNSAETGNLDLGDFSGSSIHVLAGGQMTTTKDITTDGELELATDHLINANDLTGGSVHIIGLDGQDLQIDNSGTINATDGDIVVDSALDHDLLIGSGPGLTGSFNVVDPYNIILNANGTPPNASNNIEFIGDQNFNTGKLGQTIMNADDGPNQAVIVDNGVTVVGNNTVVVNSSQLIFNGTGILIGNPLIFNGGQLGGTIANSGGDVNLGTGFTFNGKSLTILASGSINATDNLTINLVGTSSGLSNGNGGNLNILAGFDFTPLTGNKQVGPDNTPYIITGASISGGNINFGKVTMTTGSTVQDAAGGSVLAVATGSGVNAGNITLGSIDTSSNGLGSTKSVGGAVTLIGQNITVGNINTTGVTGGNVTITSAPPVITGTIHVVSGNIDAKYGSFGVGAQSTYSGNIVVGGINTGDATVNLLTGNAGSITGTSAANPIVSQNLNLLAGGGGVGSASAPLYTNVTNLNVVTTGGAYLSDGGSNLNIIGTNSASTFSLVNTNQSKITLANPINTSNLSIVDKGGMINLPTNTVSVTPVTSTGDGGTILLDANTITWPGSSSGPLVLNANAANTGAFRNGGSITVITNTPTTQTVGNGKGNFQFLASGAGNAGKAFFANLGGDTVVDQANGVSVAGGANANGPSLGFTGQHVTNAAGGVLVIDASGKGTGDGGLAYVNQLSTDPVRVGTAKTDNFQLIARGVNGGSVSILTGGALTLDLSGATYAPTGANGNGGNLLIKAASLVGTNSATSPFILDASGVGTGNGGSVSVQLTTPGKLATIGKLAGNFELFAMSGKKGGNGGSVTFINAGDLTVDPVGLKNGPLGPNGNGGSITLEAGRDNSGNLLVVKGLAVNGKGKGNGGNINLTTNGGNFAVGSTAATNINGVKGSLQLNGKVKGNVTLTNNNGDLTLASALTGLNSAALTANGPGSIFLNASVGTATTSAFVTLKAGGSITGKSASNIAAAKVVTVTAGKMAGANIGTDKIALGVNTQNLTATAAGLVNLADKSTGDTLLNTSSGNTFALTSAGNLVIGGVIAGGPSITLKSSKAITDQKSGNTLVATAVTLTSGTGGMGTTTQGVEVNTANLVANSTGNTYLKGVSTSPLNFNGAKNTKLVNLTTAGDLVVNGAIGSTGTVNLATTGTGNILQGNGLNASVNGKFVTLASPGGTVGTAVLPVTVKATNLTVNSATATGNLVNVRNTITAASVLNNSFGTSFTYLTAGPTKLNNITASNGSIRVTESKGLLQTAVGSQILANNGSITLQESDAKSGTILLGVTSKIATTGGAGSDVKIFIGPTAQLGANPKPAGVTETINLGTINYGVNGVTLLKDALVSITAKGANVVISTGDAKATAIKISNGVTIIADPPVPGPDIVNLAQPLTAGAVRTVSSMSMASPLSSIASVPLVATPAALAATPIAVSAHPFDSLFATRTAPAQRMPEEMAWISDTELATGEIPALVSSEIDLGITSKVTVVSDLSEKTSVASADQAAGKAMAMKKGSVVFAPQVDTTIETPCGQVKVAAHSVVLVMSFSNGVGVYNLHDTRHGAVKLVMGGREMKLTPGTGAVMTRAAVQAFEHVNPAQLFVYRNVNKTELGGGLKIFTSEFSIMQALRTVQPLKQLVLSNDVKAKRLIAPLLKTAGILMQLNGNGPQYKQVLRPKLVAWANPEEAHLP